VFPLKTAVRENGNCSSRIYGKRQKAEGSPDEKISQPYMKMW
jgi:hypothetical protein